MNTTCNLTIKTVNIMPKSMRGNEKELTGIRKKKNGYNKWKYFDVSIFASKFLFPEILNNC